MATTILLRVVFTTPVIVGLVLSSPKIVSAGDNNHRIARAIRQWQQQVQSIQRQLQEKHGDNVWFVFQVVGIKPNLTQSISRVNDGRRYRDYGSTTLQLQIESKAYKVKGPAAAAEMIWHGNTLPVQFAYRTFKVESEANDYYKSVIH